MLGAEALLLPQAMVVNMATDHRTRLASAGMDTHHGEACGQLDILSWQQA
jgi:hypothetical protein